MSNCKVVVLGDGSVGKTSLVCQLIGYRFNPTYQATLGSDSISFRVNDELALQIIDVSGAERFRSFYSRYLLNANIVIYCVDLKTVVSEEIQQQIRQTKQLLPGVPVILAATKCDTYVDPAEQRLNEIGQLVGSNLNIITSAATGQGFVQALGNENSPRRLIDLIQTLSASPVPSPLLHDEIETVTAPLIPDDLITTLLTSLDNEHATLNQRQQIKAALVSLSNRIQSDNTQVTEATEQFVTSCHTILEGKHPNIMSAVYSLAGALLVAGIIAVVGLSFGLTVVPVIAASSLGGMVTAGLLANSMFKERQYVSEVLGAFSTGLAEHLTPAIGLN